MNLYRRRMRSMINGELIVDNFAGGGGASTGIEEATGYCVDIAINHDPEAIKMHKANHPYTKHYCEDVVAGRSGQSMWRGIRWRWRGFLQIVSISAKQRAGRQRTNLFAVRRGLLAAGQDWYVPRDNVGECRRV